IAASHVGLISHELESIYERIIRQQISITPALIQIIRLVQDDISDRIQTIRDQGIDYPANNVIDILRNIQSIVAGERSEAVALVSAPISAETEQTAVEPDVSVSEPIDAAEDTAEA